ncbi:hypothetical protein MMC25_003060 [Agyrium rufum]|nr:hypothetical protein [Agyrium rufum]
MPRPQTLRQAKRAYQKSPNHGVSEIEMRQIQRRVELQERADRIRAKEEQKLANKVKREEKERLDTERRERMGVVDSTPRVPEGQFKIKAFLRRPTALGEVSREGREEHGPYLLETDGSNTMKDDQEQEATVAEVPTSMNDHPQLSIERSSSAMVQSFARADMTQGMKSQLSANSRVVSRPSSPELQGLRQGSAIMAPPSLPNREDPEELSAFFLSNTQLVRELAASSPPDSAPPQPRLEPSPPQQPSSGSFLHPSPPINHLPLLQPMNPSQQDISSIEDLPPAINERKITTMPLVILSSSPNPLASSFGFGSFLENAEEWETAAQEAESQEKPAAGPTGMPMLFTQDLEEFEDWVPTQED